MYIDLINTFNLPPTSQKVSHNIILLQKIISTSFILFLYTRDTTVVLYYRKWLPFLWTEKTGSLCQTQLKWKQYSRIIIGRAETGEMSDFLSFILRTWPISFRNSHDSTVHFVFFPLVHFHAFTEQRPEKEREFSFRISFWIKILCSPEGKAVQLLCNPPNTEAKWQKEERVREWKEGRPTGRYESSAGRAILTSVWHHLTHWVAFLCQDTESGREAGFFCLHSDT